MSRTRALLYFSITDYSRLQVSKMKSQNEVLMSINQLLIPYRCSGVMWCTLNHNLIIASIQGCTETFQAKSIGIPETFWKWKCQNLSLKCSGGIYAFSAKLGNAFPIWKWVTEENGLFLKKALAINRFFFCNAILFRLLSALSPATWVLNVDANRGCELRW